MTETDMLYALASQIKKSALRPDFAFVDLKTNKKYTVSDCVDAIKKKLEEKSKGRKE